MIQLYAQGWGVGRVGAELGVATSTVSRRLRSAGVQMRARGVRRGDVSDEEILRLRGTGLLWCEVAVRVGMTTPGVHSRWRRLAAAGRADPIPAGAGGWQGRRHPGAGRAVKLYRGGMSGPEVAQQLGVTASTVSKWVRAAGVAAHKPGARLPVDDGEILRLRSQGLLWREVAAQVGMSKDGVVSRWRQLREAGFEDPMPPQE